MAAVSSLGSTFNTTAGTKSVTATPAVNDLIVIITGATSTGSADETTAPTDNNSSGTYSKIVVGQSGSNLGRLIGWVRTALISSAVSTIFTYNPTIGTNTGGGLQVLKVTGMSRTGLSAILQSAKQDSQTAGTTPAPVFAAAVNTANPVIGAVMNASNPAALTPRSSPAYTERTDVGYATPTTGRETMTIDSGETATTITWGGTSATLFGDIVMELDISAPPAITYPQLEHANGRGSFRGVNLGTR